MEDFPKEYGSLPNLKAQLNLGLFTLLGGLFIVFMISFLSYWYSQEIDSDRQYLARTIGPFIVGFVFGLNRNRLDEFPYPWFSVTWRCWVWTMIIFSVTFNVDVPMMLFAVFPMLAPLFWLSMIAGQFLGIYLSKRYEVEKI